MLDFVALSLLGSELLLAAMSPVGEFDVAMLVGQFPVGEIGAVILVELALVFSAVAKMRVVPYPALKAAFSRFRQAEASPTTWLP